MKILIFLPILLIACRAGAQSTTDGVVKATVTMLEDGRHKSSLINPETHTAVETIEDNKGKVFSKTVYELNDHNVPKAATFFDAKGKTLYKASYKRDEADRISEETYISVAGQLLVRRVYTYGAKNQVTRLDVYDANGNPVTLQATAVQPRPPAKRR